MKKIFSLTVIFFLMLFFSQIQTAEAKSAEKVSVIWSNDVLSMSNSKDSILNYKDKKGNLIVRDAVAQALTWKLKQLQMSGDLPFELEESAIKYDDMHSVSGDDPIGLIPIATLDTSFDTKYSAGKKTYYRSLVFCGLSLAICSADSLNNSWKILATIQLSGYDFIGDNLDDPRTEPISDEEKAHAFIEIASSLIRNNLDFSSYKDRKLFRDLDLKSLGGAKYKTYQVDEVLISSNKAREIFYGREDEIRSIVAAFFASNYQRKTQNIVLPSRINSRWKIDVTKNLYTYQMQTPSGSVVNLSAEQPDETIQLEIYGLNSKEIETKKPSDVKRDILYKAWMRKFPADKNSDQTDSTVRRELITDDAAIEYNPADVYTLLLIDVAENLGSQKKN